MNVSSVNDPVLPATAKPLARRRRRRPSILRYPLFSGAILAVFGFAGTVGPLLTTRKPSDIDLVASLQPPVGFGGTWSHPMGTDDLGRDVFTRMVHGSRIALLVSLTVVLVAGFIGLTVAVVAGFRGGRLDAFLMRVTDASMAFPVILLAIVIVGVFGPSTLNVVIILAMAGWPSYARVLRSEVLRVRTQDFVTMARTMGASNRWSVVRHVLPNIAPTLLVLVSLQVGTAIIAEGSLSFLGLGVPPPAPSWGGMLSDGRRFLEQAWWLPVVPGIVLSLTVLAANLMGDWLRVHNDPTSKR